jgi:hypothetical protein
MTTAKAGGCLELIVVLQCVVFQCVACAAVVVVVVVHTQRSHRG